MNKFQLYFLCDHNSCKLVYSGDELSHCLSYIRKSNILPHNCMIISPNGRKITFTDNGSMKFGDICH